MRTIGYCVLGSGVAALLTAAVAACYPRQAAVLPINGAVVAVRGKAEFETFAGRMSPDGPPITRDARFRLASVSKTFTKVAIGRLVMAGKLDLTSSVRRYVPELPEAYQGVTIEHLVHHRSGVTALLRVSGDDIRLLDGARSATDILPLFVRAPLEFAPGERQQYSNGGFHLLGIIIEKVSGKNYADYYREAIFAPLGMTATGPDPDARTATPLIVRPPAGPPGAPPPGAGGAPPRIGAPPASAAGNWISSADDMLRLGKALLGDTLLSPALKAALFPKRAGVWRLGQAGGSPGTNTDFTVLPDSGDVIVVLTSADPPAGELMGEVLRLAAQTGECKPLRPEDRPRPGPPPGPPPRPAQS